MICGVNVSFCSTLQLLSSVCVGFVFFFFYSSASIIFLMNGVCLLW